MKKTTLIAALIATSIGCAAVAAEVTPMAAPKAPETPAASTPTTYPDPMKTAVVVPQPAAGTHLGSKIVGADVYSTAGEKLGDVNDLIIDGSGKITGVVVGVGGFLGVGEKNVALAWDAVTVGSDDKGKPRFSVHVTRKTLDEAAPFVATTKS